MVSMDPLDSVLVCTTMQAIERWSSWPCQKLSLTTALLAQACPLVPLAPVEFGECWEVLVLDMWFLLQLGEMVPNNEPFNPQRHLNSSSLTVTTDWGAGLVLELQLVRTKTGVGSDMCLPSGASYDVPGACGFDPSSMTFLNHLVAHGGHYRSRQVTPMVPLFQCRKGQTLQRPQVVKAIKWLVGQLECDPVQFGAFSVAGRHDFSGGARAFGRDHSAAGRLALRHLAAVHPVPHGRTSFQDSHHGSISQQDCGA